MDGSAPDPVGGFWLPATAVGEGDEPGGEDWARVATDVGVAPGCVAGTDSDGEADAVGEDVDAAVVAAGPLWVTAAEGFAALGEGLELA
ncbi:MAG: hypothetical protein M3O99_05770 [Chloroflexota bacterium]|nr:hypothetical protein [Chloroflexota bacterium]